MKKCLRKRFGEPPGCLVRMYGWWVEVRLSASKVTGVIGKPKGG